MDGVEALRETMNAARVWFNGTVGDLTPEQVNFLPPGQANPIGATVLHILAGEDAVINRMMRDGQMIWDRDGWGDRLGLPNAARLDAATARSITCDLAALAPYQEAVFANTEAYLAGLTAADLDRVLDRPMLGKQTVGYLIAMLVIGNIFAHTGEIAALKGVQAARGLPF